MTTRIITGDSRHALRELAEASVQCCVTSPPYFGLRDYGHAEQIGLEETPEAFVAQLVEVFREVRRVLRDDGTLWLNIGDSYAGSGRGGYAGGKGTLQGTTDGQDNSRVARGSQLAAGFHAKQVASGAIARAWVPPPAGLKNKDLIGIPWMLAFALRADGWYLRQEIIWAKAQSGDDRGGSVMPESVSDRCTKAHEQVFLLTKSPTYYFDADAIAEPILTSDVAAARARQTGRGRQPATSHYLGAPQRDHSGGYFAGEKANRRSVWRINTQPYAGAHFATMPPALVELCLLAGSREGDMVLDPFGGAGTTGLVAERMHRHAVLVELNPEYAALATERIRGDAPLFAEVTA
jgi:DNA modification methylase